MSALARWAFIGAIVVVMLVPSLASACPVCGASKAENDWAFGITTLVLSALPPLIFGCLVTFFVLLARRRRRQESTPSGISTPD